MSVEWWLGYVTVLLILMSTSGPSHLLMLSNSLAHGFRPSLATAAGDLSANFLQMLAATLGLAGVIQSRPGIFVVIKWLGVLYLIWLGAMRLRAGQLSTRSGDTVAPRGSKSLYMQGFLTSATNPKAIIFFAALFPQFLIPGENIVRQFAILGTTFLLLDASFLLFYGGFARWLARFFDQHSGRRFDQIAGGLLILAAVLLGLKDMGAPVGT